MQITKRSKSKNRLRKSLLFTVLAIIVIGGSYLSFAKNHSSWPFARQQAKVAPADSNTNESKDEVAPSTKATGTDKSTPSGDQSSSPKTPVKNQSSSSSSTPSSNNELDARITAASQNDSVLQIRTLIQKVTSKGSCTLTLTSGDQTVTRKAGIQALANSSTCEGFNVPTTDLSQGKWNITIHISSEGQEVTLKKTVEIT